MRTKKLDEYYAYFKLKKTFANSLNKKSYSPYSFGFVGILALSLISPVFAEVSSIQTDSSTILKGNIIKISGIVHEGTKGLVTIVIRDSNNEFVMLTQTTINPNNTFEEIIKIDDDFINNGMYSAIGFIRNMTQGSITNFKVTQSIVHNVPTIEKTEDKEHEETKIQRVSNENRNYTQKTESTSIKSTADFIDPKKDPQHYLDRYFNEPAYKSWFDRNYPEYDSIEQAVGIESNPDIAQDRILQLIDKKIIPEAQATSVSHPAVRQIDNSDIAQISLAIAGLGILFGAVYGVKRKADNNSRQISINRETIRKKLILPIIGSNPKEILQMRLVKGEITLDEFDKLKLKLD